MLLRGAFLGLGAKLINTPACADLKFFILKIQIASLHPLSPEAPTGRVSMHPLKSPTSGSQRWHGEGLDPLSRFAGVELLP